MSLSVRRCFALVGLLALVPSARALDRLVWPTPHPAFAAGQPYADFVQPTASGVPESGLFGCVRNSGARFHEGLDIAPFQPRKKGEATDPVQAILPGRVVYFNQVGGNSGYGRYIVIEHPGEDLPIYSLYAHLARVRDGLAIGQEVAAGEVIATMGRSASTGIPKERSHLHLEVGLRLTDAFGSWYTRQKFEEPNRHGLYNGFNLVGFDPLALFQAQRQGQVDSLAAYVRQLPVAAVLRVHTSRVPDFATRYPALLQGPIPSELAAWDISVTPWGLPISLRPLTRAEVATPAAEGTAQVLAVNRALLDQWRCIDLLDFKGQAATLGSDGRRLLELLTGLR